jgi:CelD/BcsL family acetyltransferase involved in cellulose biosynthesis
MTNTLTMARSLELRRADRDEWIELAEQFLDHNYRHCWDYAAMLAARSGAVAEHVVIGHDEALASVRVKRLPGLRTGVAYVSGGPLVRRRGDTDASERAAAALAALKAEYVDRRKLVLRIAPPLGDPELAGLRTAEGQRPYRTVAVDIDRPLAEVRAGLAQKWRNCLNKAERQSLRVTEGRDPELFADFLPLFDELVSRKAFDVDLDAGFYARLQSELPESERLHVAIAWVDDEPAAGVVASLHGDTAVYLLGASNHAARKANASYLLQWKVIEAAAAAGCTSYDLGGIDAEANPGVHKFKLGFGGAEVCAPGPYELAPDRARAALVRTAERAFRAIRRS